MWSKLPDEFYAELNMTRASRSDHRVGCLYVGSCVGSPEAIRRSEVAANGARGKVRVIYDVYFAAQLQFVSLTKGRKAWTTQNISAHIAKGVRSVRIQDRAVADQGH